MNKPGFKYENGKVVVDLSYGLDLDNDQKSSVTLKGEATVDAYELLTEIAKKDMPLVELVLKQIKI